MGQGKPGVRSRNSWPNSLRPLRSSHLEFLNAKFATQAKLPNRPLHWVRQDGRYADLPVQGRSNIFRLLKFLRYKAQPPRRPRELIRD